MINRLFVYGTLAPGRANSHILAGISGSWESATVRGKLIAEGWGATYGYPAIVLDENGEEVQGFIFSSHELALHWERIDAFEGEGYERVEVSVQRSDGSSVTTFIYALEGYSDSESTG